MKHKIDLADYPRKAHFEYFSNMANPYFGLTADVDVTELRAFVKTRGLSFFTVFLHCAALAANAVPEFRRRIVSGELWEYDHCPTSHTELGENGVYGYCTLRHDMPFSAYLNEAETAREAARRAVSLDEDDEVESMLFVSCVPWLRYTQLLQPTDGESNPRITWGKYETDADGRCRMPVSILVHHALADGAHAAMFYRNLEKEMEKLTYEQTD